MTITTHTSLGKLLVFLDKLEALKLTYKLQHIRDSIMVEVAVPGERWEIEFFDDGHVELERFVSSGVQTIEDESLNRLVAEWGSE